MESDLLEVSEAIARARADLVELTGRRNELILRARATGLSMRTIAGLAGITRWMVLKVVREHGPVASEEHSCNSC